MEMAAFANIANEPRPAKEEVRFQPGVKDSRVFLEAVLADAEQRFQDRLRAAIELLAYQHPRLMVTAQVNEHSFAELLERRIKKLDAMNGKPQPQTQQQIDQPIDHPQIETPRPLPRLNDRRFRRI